MSTPTQLLAKLAGHLGLADLRFNDSNVCRLVLDGRYTVDLEVAADEQTLFAHSVVGADPCPERHAELLAANLFGRGTGSAVLGLDVQRREVLLTEAFALEVELAEFVARLEAFVATTRKWTHKLHADAPTAEPTAPHDSELGGMIRV